MRFLIVADEASVLCLALCLAGIGYGSSFAVVFCSQRACFFLSFFFSRLILSSRFLVDKLRVYVLMLGRCDPPPPLLPPWRLTFGGRIFVT